MDLGDLLFDLFIADWIVSFFRFLGRLLVGCFRAVWRLITFPVRRR